jgi:hypothetical protein
MLRAAMLVSGTPVEGFRELGEGEIVAVPRSLEAQ